MQGSGWHSWSHYSTKTLQACCDMQSGRGLHVPALVIATCQAQNRTEDLLHGCRNLVPILFIHSISSSWQRAKPRTLYVDMVFVEMLVLHGFTWIFHPGYSLYYSSEVHLALKNLIIKLHVLGFSSRRITTMIQFLSSVCVCVSQLAGT